MKSLLLYVAIISMAFILAMPVNANESAVLRAKQQKAIEGQKKHEISGLYPHLSDLLDKIMANPELYTAVKWALQNVDIVVVKEGGFSIGAGFVAIDVSASDKKIIEFLRGTK